MEELKIGQEVICIRNLGYGFKVNRIYKISNVYDFGVISIKDGFVTYNFTSKLNDKTCSHPYFYNIFETLTSRRKRKLTNV